MKKPHPGVLQTDSKFLHYATRLIVILLAAGAAVLSFDALTELAIASGIREQFGWVWAVVIDGFIMVATLAAFSLNDRGRGTKTYVWGTLFVFVVFSILGNAWHAVIVSETFVLPIWVAVIVTAISPFALFLAIHLLIITISPSAEQKEEHRREVEKQERLFKLKQKELERIEELEAINEVRIAAGLEPLTSLPSGRSKKTVAETKPAPSKPVPAAKPLAKPAVRPVETVATEVAPPSQITVETLSEGTTAPATGNVTAEVEQAPTLVSVSTTPTSMTEQEVTEHLSELLQNGDSLPTGKAVGDMLGKSERTGHNFLKKFKTAHNLV